jgi:ABC-type multidrug transport system fused ATPase/permease subunit
MFGPRKKKEKVNLTKDSYRKAKRIFSYMRPYRFIFMIGWVFLILSSLVSMMFPALMGQLLGTSKDSTPLINIEGLDMTNINTILVVMLIVFGVQALFSFFRIIIFTNVTERTLRDLKRTSFNKMISYPLDFSIRTKWENCRPESQQILI